MRKGVSREPWPGGYVRITPKGRTYMIDKWIRGEHFHRSTRCTTERAAFKQLERFEADPRGYSPLGATEEGLAITLDLITEYEAWMTNRKHNSSEWVGAVVRHLGDWTEDLRGRSLRTITLQDLKRALDKRKSRRHRIEAIKAFCTWLRQEKGLMSMAEDRTLDLPVPQAVAAKTHKRRVVETGDIWLVLPKLPTVTRDGLLLQLGTSWHISEVRRFAKSGRIIRPPNGDPLAVLETPHKSGDPTRTPIRTKEHLEAAERLLAGKKFPARETVVGHMKDACEAVREDQRTQGVPEEQLMPHWRMGSLRHTVLTRAVEMGATPQEASQFANHRSLATTKKFYLDIAVPTVGVPVLRLVKNG